MHSRERRKSSMDPKVTEELRILETMVLNWKRDYLSMTSGEGDDEFLADDFQEEVTRHVSQFVRRLYENNHLSLSEANEFLDTCYGHVEDLRKTLIEGNGGQRPGHVFGTWPNV
jgi:hypothetical protein